MPHDLAGEVRFVGELYGSPGSTGTSPGRSGSERCKQGRKHRRNGSDLPGIHVAAILSRGQGGNPGGRVSTLEEGIEQIRGLRL